MIKYSPNALRDRSLSFQAFNKQHAFDKGACIDTRAGPPPSGDAKRGGNRFLGRRTLLLGDKPPK